MSQILLQKKQGILISLKLKRLKGVSFAHLALALNQSFIFEINLVIFVGYK